ncbi:MAG TPA: hypothetical protein VEA69_02815, partial [Tepidisphaeraceae bacterium]|nr:hypothetical protein [Tepidisphaeraceae bacterium]
AQPWPTPDDAVATWYKLNSSTCEGTAAAVKLGGSSDTPFLWYNGKSGGDNDKYLRDSSLARKMSNIRSASRVVAAMDGNAYNWNDIGGSSTGVSARISGRHGQAQNGGKDGFFNALFFDTHVVLLPTEPYTKAGRGHDSLRVTKAEAVFFLRDQ